MRMIARFLVLLASCVLLLNREAQATNYGGGYIQDLYLYNTRSNPGTKLYSLESGVTVIDLAATGTDLTIVAKMNSTVIGYVVYEFDDTYTNRENFPFYALNGNSGSYLIPFEPITILGMHTIVAKFYHIKTNELLDSVKATFEVIDSQPGSGPLKGFNLIDTRTGDGAILPRIVDLSTFGKSLSIIATTEDEHNVEDVLFFFDNSFVRTEYTGPWAINGNKGDTIFPFHPLTVPGIHTVLAVAKGYNQETIGNITFTFIVRETNAAPSQRPIGIPMPTPTAVPTFPTILTPTKSPTGNHTSSIPISTPSRSPSTTMSLTPSRIRQTLEPTNFELQPSNLPSNDATKSPVFTLIPTSPVTIPPAALTPVPSLPSTSPVPTLPSVSPVPSLPSISPVPSLSSETEEPTSVPTRLTGSDNPTGETFVPTENPSTSSVPVPEPSASPIPTLPPKSEEPYSLEPTMLSSAVPTKSSDSEEPTNTGTPSSNPVSTEPTQLSSVVPTISMETIEPVGFPSTIPTAKPTILSSVVPTQATESELPTSKPSTSPSQVQSEQPTIHPTSQPTLSSAPSLPPTSEVASAVPTATPVMVASPSMAPVSLTEEPSVPVVTAPTMAPFVATAAPVIAPTGAPIAVPAPISAPTTSGIITGELRKWHKLTLEFTGPMASETDTDVNPFMDYRLDVTFTHAATQKEYDVPGFYAADGNAAESSATSGDKWHCHFSPDEVGLWTYDVSFVSGADVAVNGGGTPTSFDGETGSFVIIESNKNGRDLRSKGRLKYVGEHHLQFAEGEWFLKVGADSPENFLAYNDFDNTPDYNGYRKSWSPHVEDYRSGDPTWQGGKGTGIIGAINYLSNEGMNAFSFLTLNIDGDDENVFPYISDTPEDRLRIDVSKLAQWEIVLEHADTMGMYLHFKMAEQENAVLLDGGFLGNERKLYYRELIARFGHHLALNWNLSEEIENTVDQIQSYADYVKEVDPYNHIVIFHTSPNSGLYSDFLGFPSIDGASLQNNPDSVFEATLNWVSQSAATGKKWIVANDEQNPALVGVLPDSDDPEHNDIRINSLWGNIMAGGAGVEYYFGYAFDNSDLTCEDFRSRAIMWQQSRYALEFFKNYELPFWTMTNQNFRLPTDSSDRVLASEDGFTIVVYRINEDSSSIIMTDLPFRYSISWYNPREGGALEEGTITAIVGGSDTPVSYGNPPESPDADWVVLFRRL